LQLLRVVASFVHLIPDALARIQFGPAIELLLQMVTRMHTNARVLRAAFECMCKLLNKQQRSSSLWSQPLAMKSLNALLAFIDDPNPQICQAVQSGVATVVKHHPHAAAYVAEFATHTMRECQRHEFRKSVAVCDMLSRVGGSLPKKHLVDVCLCALRLPACGQPSLTAASLRYFDFVFQSTQYTLTAEQTGGLIEGLIQSQIENETRDMESNVNLCNALASGMSTLARLNQEAAM
jgi:hypothetical protein